MEAAGVRSQWFVNAMWRDIIKAQLCDILLETIMMCKKGIRREATTTTTIIIQKKFMVFMCVCVRININALDLCLNDGIIIKRFSFPFHVVAYTKMFVFYHFTRFHILLTFSQQRLWLVGVLACLCVGLVYYTSFLFVYLLTTKTLFDYIKSPCTENDILWVNLIICRNFRCPSRSTTALASGLLC